MKKLFSFLTLLFISGSYADCLVQLDVGTQPSFVELTCRDATRECSKFKRANGYEYGQCLIIDRHYIPGHQPSRDVYDIVDRMDFIEKAAKRLITRIHVKLNVSGWAHQLYVNGTFSGNYHKSRPAELTKLKRRIRDLMRNQPNVHRLKSERKLKIILLRPNLINKVTYFKFQGCHIKPNVSGWAHQLYVGGIFHGNFNLKKAGDENALRSKLANFIVDRKCVRKPRHIISLMEDQTVLDDMINQQYRHCEVKPYVSGWAHQLYVRGNFKGNFKVSVKHQRMQLMAKIANLIDKGTCIYDPI